MNNECFYNDFSCDGCDMINGCTYFNKSKILQIIKEMKWRKLKQQQEALTETYKVCYRAKHNDAKDRFIKYKQALDKIEQEVKWVVDNRECYELRDADRYKRILDIINKVEEK